MRGLILSGGRAIIGGWLRGVGRVRGPFDAGLPELFELAERPERDVTGQGILGKWRRWGAGSGRTARRPRGRSTIVVAIAIGRTWRPATP